MTISSFSNELILTHFSKFFNRKLLKNLLLWRQILFMKIHYQNIEKEKGRAPRLYCEARPGVMPRTSLRRIRLESEGLLTEAKKHRLRRVDTEKPVADGTTDLRVLVLKMASVVILDHGEHFVHIPLVSGMEQDVGYVVPQVRAAIAEDGERTVPGRAELRLQDVTELLFVDFGHKASFQGSGLSSQHDSTSRYSYHDNDSISNSKTKTETFQSFCSKINYENFSFLLLTESEISFCPEKSVRFGRRDPPKAGRGIDFSNVVRVEGIEPSTSVLSGQRSTTELHSHIEIVRPTIAKRSLSDKLKNSPKRPLLPTKYMIHYPHESVFS